MKLKATIISLVSIFIVGISAILLYCYWPAIKGTVDDSKYYTAEELQESYDKGFEDGCKSETELTGQVKYYKDLVDEYYIQVNTLNSEITTLTKKNNDYKTQITNLFNTRDDLELQVNNLTTIKTNNEETITQLNSQITTLQKEVAELENDNDNKDTTIEQKNSQITSLQATVSQLQRTNELNVETITNLNNQIASLNSQISDMTMQIQNNSSNVSALNNKIAELEKSVSYYEQYIANLENGEQVVATFEFNGSVYNIQIVNKNDTVSVVNPTSTDYVIFNYWTVNGEKIDLSTYQITTNTKIVANVTYKYDVRFMVDDEVYNSQIVVKNGYATLPTNPTKDGYEFDGWTTNGVDIISYINTTAVIQNITYIAKFTKIHMVTFIADGETVDTQQVRNGGYATLPTNPTKDGYDFDGWTTNGVDIVSNINTTMVTQNTTYVAKFTKVHIFDSDYVSQLSSMDSNITSDSISSISFLHKTTKNDKLGTLNSGIDVYYSIDTNSRYVLDFVLEETIFAPSSCTHLFYGFINLHSINFFNFDTSNVIDMDYMFFECKSLTSIDLSNFDTSNVTDMSYMFYQCHSLTSLDLSNFDTSNVMDMSSMFFECKSLTSIDLSNFDTSNVTDMSSMFYGCVKLESLDLSNFDTSNVTNMMNMFNECKSLTSLDLSNFDTSNVIVMRCMFGECKSLTSLDLSNFDTSNVMDMSHMFHICESLTSLDLSNFDTSNVTYMSSMFFECKSLTSLDLSNFDTSNVTDMSYMFYRCEKLKSVIVGENYTLDNLPV